MRYDSGRTYFIGKLLDLRFNLLLAFVKISDDVRARLERERDGRRVPFSLNAIAREAMIIGLEALEKGK